MPKPESSDIDAWALLEELPGAVAVLDAEGALRYANQAFYRALPAAAVAKELEADFFGALLPSLCAGDDVASLARAVREALDEGRGQVVEIAVTGSGGKAWLSVRLTPVALGGRRGVSLHLSDVTAERAAEDALLRLKQKFSDHVLQAPVAIIELDAEGKCIDWNPAAERMFGYTRQEALGHTMGEIILPAALREAAVQFLIDLKAGAQPVQRDRNCIRKDGSPLLCEWFTTMLRDQRGEVAGFLSLSQDVTERRRAVEILQQSALEQEQRAAEAEREAREKDRLVRELDEQLAVIADQHRQIVELSVPILEVWDEVLAVPIIGAMDAQRSALLMARLLPAVVSKRSRCVILDLTSVKQVDNAAAEHVTRVVQAVQLLGATGVLTGIRPAVAQTMIALGVDLSSIATYRSLREGLKACKRG